MSSLKLPISISTTFQPNQHKKLLENSSPWHSDWCLFNSHHITLYHSFQLLLRQFFLRKGRIAQYKSKSLNALLTYLLKCAIEINNTCRSNIDRCDGFFYWVSFPSPHVGKHVWNFNKYRFGLPLLPTLNQSQLFDVRVHESFWFLWSRQDVRGMPGRYPRVEIHFIRRHYMNK